jgi:hypothetical protein
MSPASSQFVKPSIKHPAGKCYWLLHGAPGPQDLKTPAGTSLATARGPAAPTRGWPTGIVTLKSQCK